MNCKLEEVFDLSFIELLRLVPNNPIVRGLVLRLTGKLPGEECTTFEQLKSWVEANCTRRRRLAYRTVESVPGINIDVSFREKEYGRASYSINRSGDEQFPISADELVDIIREVVASGGGLNAVLKVIRDLIDDEAWDRCSPAMEDSDDYDYYDHNSTDTDDCETDYSTDQIREQVLHFVRNLHPELAVELEAS